MEEMLATLGQEIVAKGPWLLILMVIDVLMGSLIAVKNHEFKWEKLSDFVVSYSLRALGWLSAEVITVMPAVVTSVGALAPVIGGGVYVIVLSYPIGSILGHMKNIGILPGVIAKIGG